MTNVPPVPLTRSGERARAAGIIAAAARITSIEAFRLVDIVDAIAAAALAAAGLDEKTTRRVLTTLWEPPTSSARPADRPVACVSVTPSGPSCATSVCGSGPCAARGGWAARGGAGDGYPVHAAARRRTRH